MRWLRVATLALLVSLAPTWAGPNAQPSAAPSANPTTVPEIVAAVESTYASVNSLKADFVQVSRSTSMGQETRQRGKVSLKRPRKMRWDFNQPDASTFVTDGATMWVYSSANNQVIVSPVSGGAGGMTQLLDDLNNLDELFTVTLVDAGGKEGKGSYILDLVPKALPSNFKKLRLTLARNKYTPETVLLTDTFDNQVELTFSQVKFNQDIPDSMFNFQAPQGATVLNTGGM